MLKRVRGGGGRARRVVNLVCAATVSALLLGVLGFGYGGIPALGPALDPGRGAWTSAAGLTGADQAAAALLRSWNGDMDQGSAAASLWWTFWRSYLNTVFAPWRACHRTPPSPSPRPCSSPPSRSWSAPGSPAR